MWILLGDENNEIMSEDNKDVKQFEVSEHKKLFKKKGKYSDAF